MKKGIVLICALALLANVAFPQKKNQPKTKKEKINYSIGVTLGRNLTMQGIDVDQTYLIQGLKDALSKSATLMTDNEMETTMTAFQEELMAKMQEKQLRDGDKNKKVGEDFLAANKKKEGVVTLPSGLQYKIIKAGNGPKPSADQTVRVHYKGTLIDGTEFDSSYKRGEPAEFPVGQVIKGWVEAIQLMPVGSKWQLFIPSDLAYGPNGAGQMIGPNSTLIFEVELLGIK